MTDEHQLPPRPHDHYHHAFGFPFWFHPPIQPIYDDNANYNTNAKNYYDYLARDNRSDELLYWAVNRLLARNIEVKDTNCVDMTKIGDWIDNGTCSTTYPPNNYDDIITLQCEVVLSNYVQSKTYTNFGDVNCPNSISCRNDGLFSPDYANVLDQADQEITTIKQQIEQLYQAMAGVSGEIEIPREINITNSNNLKNKVDLGSLTDNTRVEITWHFGSTRGTNTYYVRDLKGINCHIMAINADDNSDQFYVCEYYTRIVDGNKLWATTSHRFNTTGQSTDSTIYTAYSHKTADNTPYYDTQDPGDFPVIDIDRVVVYDRVPIIQN